MAALLEKLEQLLEWQMRERKNEGEDSNYLLECKNALQLSWYPRITEFVKELNDAETFSDARRILFEYFPKWMPLALSSCTITIYYVVFRIRLRIAQWRVAERRKVEKKYSLLEDLHEVSMLTCNDENSFSGKEKLFFASKSGRIIATPKRVKMSQRQGGRKSNRNNGTENVNTFNSEHNKNTKNIYFNGCGSVSKSANKGSICISNYESSKVANSERESHNSLHQPVVKDNNNDDDVNAHNSYRMINKDDESSESETDLESETESNDSFDDDDDEDDEDDDETAVSMRDVEEFRSSLGIRLPRDDDLLALIERMLLLDPIPQGWVLYRTTAGLIRFMNVNTQELFFFPPNKRRLQKYVEQKLKKRSRQAMESKYVILYEDENHINSSNNTIYFNQNDDAGNVMNNGSSSNSDFKYIAPLRYSEKFSCERSPEPSHECIDGNEYVFHSALQHRNRSTSNNTNSVTEQGFHLRRARADTPGYSSRERDYLYVPHATQAEINSTEAIEHSSEYSLELPTDNNNNHKGINRKSDNSKSITWEDDNSNTSVNDNDSTFTRIFRYFKEKEQRRIEEEVARSHRGLNAATIAESISEETNATVYNQQ